MLRAPRHHPRRWTTPLSPFLSNSVAWASYSSRHAPLLPMLPPLRVQTSFYYPCLTWTPTHTTNRTVLSQRERCQEAFLATRDSLLESLDPQSAQSVIEASSLLGRKWLSVIPFSAALSLSDCQVSEAPHARTLLPGAATHYRHCGALNQPGHDEICLRRAPWTVARHEQAKRAMGTALATVQGSRFISNL
jgi:hypothetical protein